MMGNKIIIKNETSLSDAAILSHVIDVIEEGRVSKTSKGKQYCFVTAFGGGPTIYADRTESGTDIFTIKKGGN